jgi:hypothetical protein
MNERIQELHGQAYLYALHNETKAREGGCHEPGSFNNHYREKFAELIVRECQTVVEWAISVDSTIDRVPVLIREHFGVEE